MYRAFFDTGFTDRERMLASRVTTLIWMMTFAGLIACLAWSGGSN